MTGLIPKSGRAKMSGQKMIKCSSGTVLYGTMFLAGLA